MLRHMFPSCDWCKETIGKWINGFHHTGSLFLMRLLANQMEISTIVIEFLAYHFYDVFQVRFGNELIKHLR